MRRPGHGPNASTAVPTLGLCVLLAFLPLAWSACTEAVRNRPPVDFSNVRMPKGIEGDYPFRAGLDPLLLPQELAGRPLDERTVFPRTSSYGFRTVVAVYDKIVVMMTKVPEDADVEAGIVYASKRISRNAPGAAEYLRRIMEGTVLEPGAYYSAELVTAAGSDETGLLWFTTEGPSTLLWQVPRSDRASFWFRSGTWVFGLEAEDTETRDVAAAEMIEHLKGITQSFNEKPN